MEEEKQEKEERGRITKWREKIFVLSAVNRKLGYWRTGTSTTEMQIPVDMEKVVPGLEAWAENLYTVYLQHTLNLREVLESLQTYWPIRASRRTCQSEGKAGFSGCSGACFA